MVDLTVVPDMDEEIVFDEEAPDLSFINDVVNTAGIEALTEDEYALYQQNEPEPADTSHYANLAEQLDDTTLDRIANQVIDWVDSDEESRDDWEKRESKGIRLLGVSDKTEGGASFEGASKVVHPLLIEAISQFHSRALTEMWPAEGPVKAATLGTATPELNAQAERVQDYMNYQYTQQMPGAFEEEDQMLFRLPLSGSCFKKTYYCELEKTVVSRLVEPADFIVPYTAIDLRSAHRFTHKFYENHNDLLKKQASGYYAKDYKLSMPINEDEDKSRIYDEIDHVEGRHNVQLDEDQRHVILEMYVDLVIDGFADMSSDGEMTEIAVPYIVTVDKEEQKVLRIQRNYKPSDPLKKKRIYFTHYKFNPGFGFYGFGLLHLIGGLSNSATGALRALLDSASFANQQGGFKTRDSRIKGGDTPIAPGEWREVNSSAEELSKGFFPLPYKEPSKTLFELLGYLDERGQRFASTTENMVGEANANAPVGTTLALIEQGSKVFSAIHKRLHEAHNREFKIVAELNYDYLPDEGYPYMFGSMDREIMRSDFDGRIDVIPVSDPAIISTTQRITQAQAILDLADKYPDVVNRRKAVENMLQSMRISGYEDFIMPEQQEQSPEEEAQALENQKTQAEIEKIQAEAVNKSVEGMYSGLQAGQAVATMPGVVPITDELLASAGYVDKNGAPLAQQPSEALQQPTDYKHITHADEIPTNTNPLTPANPGVGLNQGIETLENDI